jgi:hypothetical protein
MCSKQHDAKVQIINELLDNQYVPYIPYTSDYIHSENYYLYNNNESIYPSLSNMISKSYINIFNYIHYDRTTKKVKID